MITISEAVKSRLTKTPFIEELLEEDMVNVMSLARKIRPEIEELCMKEVTEDAIAMAIRRMPKRSSTQPSLNSIFKDTPDVLVRSNLCEFTIKKEGNTGAIERIVKTISLSSEHFFTITQGVFEDTIIVSDVFEPLVRNVLKLQQILGYFDKLAAVTVRLPPENVSMPGVYYHILKSLAQKGINVMEVVSTFRECTIIVSEKDVDEAFTNIKRVFGR